MFDGFQSTLLQWLTKYITVSLWMPVANIFGAVLARLQTLSLEKDMELMASDPFYMFEANNMVYLTMMIIAVVGYFMIPSISGWIVSASGMGTYNRRMNIVMITAGRSILKHGKEFARSIVAAGREATNGNPTKNT